MEDGDEFECAARCTLPEIQHEWSSIVD